MKTWSARQRGMSTLFIAAILLFIMSVGVLYANRNIIFEQRTSANQMKQTSAMEVAEAGLQWTIGMLNHPNDIDTACKDSTTSAASFRKSYFQPSSTGFTPLTNVKPGCAWDPSANSGAGAWTCGCPTTGVAAPTLSTSGAAVQSFTVSFAVVASDPTAVQVTSTGCTPQTAMCAAGATSGADASATITAILKVSPLLPGEPAAAVTCGTDCNFSGSFNVVNTDVLTHGVLVNAGGTAGTPPGATTLPGQPVQNALLGSDSSLSSLASSDPTCSNSKMFQSFFGTTLQEYQNAPSTDSITCSSASDCGSQMQSAYDNGWRSFYFPSGFQYNNSSGGNFGTPSDPVTIVTSGSVTINGNINIYGVVFSNDANLNDLGTGNSTIDGALVTCAGFKSNGNGSVTYDPAVMNSLNKASGTIVPVPGSWHDW
ncbi:pilus assembly PilX family protein [Ralstonia soli]|uniref:Pilus assembly PilX N-terminal domain-containing protein n=1 Tax=Ralstonia soli TaxID=2953896 RepID=A0ABT1ANM3_9RALS|nr:PilX N-terminal domain-containing pilus assembly protein [Ralstonia soli]MCO5400040.1 pilus assembly PilX N-terminal domain-containing protein [Ralstonia soli]